MPLQRVRRLTPVARARLAGARVHLPPNREDVGALRVVVKNGFTRDLAELFLTDLKTAVAYLDRLEGPLPAEAGETFHH